MRNGCVRAFSTLAAFFFVALPSGAQSVISTRSGVVNFFEGNVYLGDQPLESHLGRYLSVPRGAELRTADGPGGEYLLTPGVFLRMGERSAIRMVANSLADTQVKLQTGSVILDSGEPSPGTSVSLVYKDRRVHLLQKGVYRIDCDPPGLSVRQGEAEVFAANDGQPVTVASGMSLPLADDALVPQASTDLATDGFSDWNNGRSQSIAADDAITAQIGEDPTTQTDADSFTYYPYLGLSSLGVVSPGPYTPYAPYQAGFNSIYLPGYTYQPLLLGLGRARAANLPPVFFPYGRIGVCPASRRSCWGSANSRSCAPRAQLCPSARGCARRRPSLAWHCVLPSI